MVFSVAGKSVLAIGLLPSSYSLVEATQANFSAKDG
jgi:hypothetical protein